MRGTPHGRGAFALPIAAPSLQGTPDQDLLTLTRKGNNYTKGSSRGSRAILLTLNPRLSTLNFNPLTLDSRLLPLNSQTDGTRVQQIGFG